MARIRKYPRNREDHTKEMEKWSNRLREYKSDKKEFEEEINDWRIKIKRANPELKKEIRNLKDKLESKLSDLRDLETESRQKLRDAENALYEANRNIYDAEGIVEKLQNLDNYVAMQEYLKENPDKIISAFKVNRADSKGSWWRNSISGKVVPNVIGGTVPGGDPVARIKITPQHLEISIKDGGSGNFSDNTMFTAEWQDVEVQYEDLKDVKAMITFDQEKMYYNDLKCCWQKITPRYTCPDMVKGHSDKHSTWGSEPCDSCGKHKRANPKHNEVHICKCGNRLRVSEYTTLVGA